MEVVAPEPGGESDVDEPTRYSAGAPQMEVAAVDGGEEADDEAERPAYSREARVQQADDRDRFDGNKSSHWRTFL